MPPKKKAKTGEKRILKEFLLILGTLSNQGLVFYFRVLGVRLYVAFRLFVRMWRRFGFWVYSRRMSESYLNPKRRRMSDRRRMSESYLNPKKRRPCAFFWPTLPTRNDTSSDVSVRSKP